MTQTPDRKSVGTMTKRMDIILEQRAAGTRQRSTAVVT
jgi:hypothetical protein